MSGTYDNYVIEISSGAVGVIVRERGGFRFFSSSRNFDALDGQSFSSPQQAEAAAMRLAAAKLKDNDIR